MGLLYSSKCATSRIEIAYFEYGQLNHLCLFLDYRLRESALFAWLPSCVTHEIYLILASDRSRIVLLLSFLDITNLATYFSESLRATTIAIRGQDNVASCRSM
jgi:hypothetical protein